MNKNLTICNNCCKKIVLSLNEHVVCRGFNFCCQQCADHFFSTENLDTTPVGWLYDLGVEGEI